MKNYLLLLCAPFALPLFASCFADSLPGIGNDASGVQQDALSHGMMVLGKQLPDPYSVENMTKAVESLYPTKAGTFEVATTHLYVRFLPSDQKEYELLDSLGVELVDHPVDYEIIREGDYYHDPGIPENDITWQYAVVPPDFSFPAGIRHEILDRCHITEHEVITRSDADGIDWEAVEREAFRITGNAHMLSSATKAESAAKPSGRITLVDGRYPDSPEGVKGVRVACNVFVKISQAYTDDEGYYELGKSFSSNPRYWLVFKNRKGYGIGLNLILVGGSVSTLGKHSAQGYDKEVSAKSDRSLFARCVVNNAVWDYFGKCADSKVSMKAPPSNLRLWIFSRMTSGSAVMMQHGAAIDNTKIGEYLGEYATLVKWFLPDITIGTGNCHDYASIYSQTIHELAHASHFQQVGKDWWNKLMTFEMTAFVSSGMLMYGTGGEEDSGYCEVAEMWAYFVQTQLFRQRYPDSQSVFGTSWWFYPQIFMYLDDKGLGYHQISRALVSEVSDRELLREKLLALYPDFKTNIMLAFNRYYR